jgi:hypothetical protein
MLIRSERGATIIFIAIAMFGLLAFAAMAIDHGALMAARGQAQTSADAAALATAQAMAFDNTSDVNYFKAVGQAAGKANKVFGYQPDILATDIEVPLTCPPSPPWASDNSCVRARAYLTSARGNPLPTFFAKTFGLSTQGVQATATARAIAGNATNCLKPWAVADKWLDTQAGGWDQNALYQPANGDSYTPPSATSYGNGFSDRDGSGLPTYHGYQMVLKYSNPGQGQNSLPINSAGWAMELSLNNAAGPINSTGAYVGNITGCTTDVVAINNGTACGTTVNPANGCLDVRTGSSGANNKTAIEAFIQANDPDATWVDGTGGDWKTGKITNSAQSPSSRIVPVAIFHLPEYLAAGYDGTNGIVRVVNIVGFFVEGTCQSIPNSKQEPYLQCPTGGSAQASIVGRLVNYPALAVPTGGTVMGSFGQVIVLVR